MRAVRMILPHCLVCLIFTVCFAYLISLGVDELAPVMAPETQSMLPTVVLDPGHGGEDGGALSPGGVRESGLNLEIGLRTRDLLRFLGLPVVMTRETDRSICDADAGTISEKKRSDLRNRVRIVEETENALLVSIHQNMFSESKYRGGQVFYAGTPGSRALAERLQALFSEALDPANHRQAKQSTDVYLLKQIRCTGILVECGFLSNPGEEQLLQRADYQKKLAAAISAALTLELSQIQYD